MKIICDKVFLEIPKFTIYFYHFHTVKKGERKKKTKLFRNKRKINRQQELNYIKRSIVYPFTSILLKKLEINKVEL